jgi:enediyne biosynthesis protein E4
MLAGNDYGTEVFNGRLDAGNGLTLRGNGTGNFFPVPASESGFFIQGNAKSMVSILDITGKMLFITAENKGSMKCFENNLQKEKLVKAPAGVVSYFDSLANGKIRRQELYYGSGFLSQSGRYLAAK